MMGYNKIKEELIYIKYISYTILSANSYLTISYGLASNLMVHEILVAPPRPNINTFDGERNIPRAATFDLK